VAHPPAQRNPLIALQDLDMHLSQPNLDDLSCMHIRLSHEIDQA